MVVHVDWVGSSATLSDPGRWDSHQTSGRGHQRTAHRQRWSCEPLPLSEPHLIQHVDYLATGAPRSRRGLVATAVRLGKDWARVCAVVLRAEVRLLHVNPSLNARAVLREAWNVLAARVAGKKVVVFWHGWDWDFAARLDRRLWALLFRVSYAQADAHVVLASRFRDYLLQRGCTGPVYCESTAVPDELFGAIPQDAPTSPGPL